MTRARTLLPLPVALLLLISGCSADRPTRREPHAGNSSTLPNLLFILTDDQRADTLDAMPATRRFFGVDFPVAVATTPLCCPSRASFLTGRYAHDTGVLTNGHYPRFQDLEPDSLGPWLQARGYTTALLGKYFNRYGVNDPVPPGWDDFHALVWDRHGGRIGNSTTSFALRERWINHGVVRNEIVRYPNLRNPAAYITTVLADLADRFIRRAEDPAWRGKPWALFIWPNAPSASPEQKYRRAEVPRHRLPPSYLEIGDAPPEVRSYPSPSREQVERLRARDLRSLLSIDDLVARLARVINELGLRAETWGLYTSDHGKLWGEHGLETKIFAYEESIRIPFRMATPGRDRRIVRELVANIDVAPTLLELAGDSGSHGVDGRSVVRLAQGRVVDWRTAILVEGWGDLDRVVRYEGVRTRRWKFVRWLRSGEAELYDLANDPFELVNVAAGRPAVERRLHRLMRTLKVGG